MTGHGPVAHHGSHVGFLADDPVLTLTHPPPPVTRAPSYGTDGLAHAETDQAGARRAKRQGRRGPFDGADGLTHADAKRKS